MKQQAILFGENRSLSGIITRPDNPREGAPAVVFLTAGVIHRVGPNCLYARLSHALAAQGVASLRFDFSGVGDSRPRADHLPFSKSALLESRAAMDILGETTGAQRFVVAGLCSGAFAAVKAAAGDPRVSGAIALNAQTLQDGDQDEFQSYAAGRSIARHLMNPRTWLKIFDGTARYEGKLEVLAGQLTGVLRKRRLTQTRRAIAQQLHQLIERDVHLLFVYSKGDPGLEYFKMLGDREIRRLLKTGRLQLEIIPGTDHIFAPPEALDRVRRLCVDWVRQLPAAIPGPSGEIEPEIATPLASGSRDPRSAREQGLNLSYGQSRH